MLVFLTTANETMMALPFLVGDSWPPNAQNLKRGAAGAFWRAPRTGAAAPRSGSTRESNCVAKSG